MKIAITGGAGFIGGHLTKNLLRKGHTVICVDNFVTGNKENIAGLKNNFSLIEHDITLPFKDDTRAKIEEVDIIYNLASPASPNDYHDFPLQTLWTNAAGTKNILDIAAKKNITLIQASTSEVYGDPKVHPQKESYFGSVNPVGPRSCYTEAKRYAESLCVNYRKQYHFPLKIVRIFNTYGPGMQINDGRVIPEFIKKALTGQELTVKGNGSQTRSFCYIDDMISALINIPETEENFIGPVNIGNPEEISIKQLARLIINLANSKSAIIEIEKENDDAEKRCPDISLAAKKINFTPKINLETGLKETIKYIETKIPQNEKIFI